MNTHCRSGHAYDVFGFYLKKNGGRGTCRECARLRNLAKCERNGGWRKPNPPSDQHTDTLKAAELLELKALIEVEPRRWVKDELRAKIALVESRG
tara:strand:+ start:11406 stop:11690 length:285 start_codon:yes stop_codon:yes gene_type:complete